MDDAERREVIAPLNNLAHYVAQGHPLEWHEPQPRGRKGSSHEARRTISFTVLDVRGFDSIGWALMKRAMSKRGTHGQDNGRSQGAQTP